jgi:hypothetical protein
VEARRLRPLWYQVDERDADLGAVFYYLRQAAVRASPRRRWQLPLLTPEYAAGIGAFCRRWFEELFAGLPQPIALVFDNYQDVGVDSGLHGLLRCALETLPEIGDTIRNCAYRHGWHGIAYCVPSFRRVAAPRLRSLGDRCDTPRAPCERKLPMPMFGSCRSRSRAAKA